MRHDDSQLEIWEQLDKRANERSAAEANAKERERVGHPEDVGLPALVMSRSGWGQTNNMTPANSNWPDSSLCPPSTAKRPGGFDWLAFSASVLPSNWEGLRAELEAGKQAAQAAGGTTERVIGGVPCTIAGYGFGKGTSHRHYVLKVDGVRVSIRDVECEKNKANFFFEFRGAQLLRDGLPKLLKAVDDLLKLWNCSCGSTWVSRVDFCADIAGLTMKTVSDAYLNAQHVRSTKKASMYFNGEKVETLNIGAPGSPCQCRLYDKRAELSRDKGRLEAFKVQALNGEDVGCLTRVEFQVRRDKLRELNVVSLADLLGNVERICGYLSWKWLRFTPNDKEVDRDNTTRAGVAKWWQEVRGHFESWSRDFASIPVVKRVGAGTNARKMVAQALGCLKRAAAEMIIDAPCDPGTGVEVEATDDQLENASTAAADTLLNQLAEAWDDYRDGVARKVRDVQGLTAAQTSEWFSLQGAG